MRICNVCGIEKQIECFSKRTTKRKNGIIYSCFQRICKSCRNKAQYKRRKENPEAYEKMKARARKRSKRLYDKEPSLVWKRARKWVDKKIEGDSFKEVWLKNKYGLSLDQYNQMRLDQEYKCKICLKSEKHLGYLLNVDHCHDKGHVRGLLCVGCNTAIGKLKHDPEVFKRAIDYLVA